MKRRKKKTTAEKGHAKKSTFLKPLIQINNSNIAYLSSIMQTMLSPQGNKADMLAVFIVESRLSHLSQNWFDAFFDAYFADFDPKFSAYFS